MKLRKISLPSNYRNCFTLSDLDAVKLMINSIINDDGKIDLTWEAEALCTLGSDNKMLPCDILSIEAEYSKNCNIEYDRYREGSEYMDIWITIKAFASTHGFYLISGYLSDAWDICSAPGCDNRDEIRSRMYVVHYSKDR